MAISAAEVLHAWFKVSGAYPPTEAQLEADMRNFDTVGELEDRLSSDLGVPGRSPTGPSTLPRFAERRMREEVGQFAAYLSVPELTPILVQSAAENWEPSKLRARVETTDYFQKTTQRQRQWELLSDAEKRQTQQRWRVQVMQTLRSIYGPEHVEQQGWSLDHPKVQRWAEDLARGRQTEELFTFAHRGAAEGIEGTPAHTARVEEMKEAGAEEVAQENLRGDLAETWRTWLGSHVSPPADLKTWAENINANRRSMQDFEDFVKQTAGSLYPEKPENVSYREFVSPAKTILARTLELGVVPDDEPLLNSYVRGEVPSLAELKERARRDPRFARTSAARKDARQAATSVLDQWEFQ